MDFFVPARLSRGNADVAALRRTSDAEDLHSKGGKAAFPGETMGNELVINTAAHETRIALIENGTIAELYIERSRVKGIV